MRNLILVTLVLQLVLILTEAQEYQFGDIISYKRGCGCSIYKHFAIYVGDDNIQGRKTNPSHNVFQRTGIKPLGHCQFGKLEAGGKKDNYLDKYKKYQEEIIQPGHAQRVRERIIGWLDNCTAYNVLNNNCEHLATHVRYGVTVSVQEKMLAAYVCNSKGKLRKRAASCPDYDKMVEENIRNAEIQSACVLSTKCPVKAG